MTNKVSIIIPCYPPHISHLPNCFSNIFNQTVLPFEVILAISQVNDSEKNNLINKYNPLFSENKHINFIVHNTVEKQYAGQNRNRGASIANGDILMFIDADDPLSKYKIELTLKYMQEYNADVLMHTFDYIPDTSLYHKSFDKDISEIIKTIKVYNPEQIITMVFGNPPNRNRNKELKSIRALCKNFPPGITMGYSTIKSHVFKKIKYSDRSRGEDTLFFKDCVWARFKTILITCPLINYLPSSSATPVILS